MTYRERLAAAVAARGNLCVGIDPHAGLLESWGLSDDAYGLAEFSRIVVDALGDKVAVFKPQSAFFERHGSAGVAVLEETLATIRAAGAISILDVKRGDIGSTMSAYASAYLRLDSPLRADAITLSPYLGFGSLSPALELAAETDAGLYLLVRTSNPEGVTLQGSKNESGISVAQQIIDESVAWTAQTGFDGIGAVIGATLAELGLNLDEYDGSILAPGVGAQGGTIEGLSALFGENTKNVLPSVSREVLGAGPQQDSLIEKLRELLS